LESARRAERELCAEVVVIMKTSKEYGLEADAPPCPSVKVNNSFVVRRGLITYEQIKAALMKEERRS
jgi:hypothetical protein